MPSDVTTETAARAPKPEMTPTAVDERARPFCASLVATAVSAVLVDVELPLPKVTDSSPAVTVTVWVGAWALMKAVAVTVGLGVWVSSLAKHMFS